MAWRSEEKGDKQVGHRDNRVQIMWVLRDPRKAFGFHSEWDEQPLQGLTKE